MIYVKLSNHSFWYDVYNIIRMFFKRDEIILSEHEDHEDYENNECKECNMVNTTIIKDKSIIVNLTVDISKTKKELSRQVYNALQQYTGKQMPWGMLTGVRPVKIAYEMMEEGMDSKKVLKKLENYYFIKTEKASLACKVAKTEMKILKNNMKDMVSLYIGIPFCKTRCQYCSFTSNCIDKNAHLVQKYLESLKREICIVNREIIKNKALKIQTIYIGGGTPTSVNKEQLADLLQFIEETLDLQYMEEYTLEAGRPDTIDKEKLLAIKNSRVNRISINPQTMNQETLNAIGRNHTPEQLKESYYLARKIGFENINMDVIVGLPGENIHMFEHTIREIQNMNPESLTVHSLAVKRASKLKEKLDKIYSNLDAGAGVNVDINNDMSEDREGLIDLASDEAASAMADMAYNYAISMGMHPYYLYRQKNITGNLENVGYSKPGFESIYNIQIMEEKQTIIAFGAGAVTKVVYPEENRLERAFNVKNLEDYINRAEEMVNRKKKLF